MCVFLVALTRVFSEEDSLYLHGRLRSLEPRMLVSQSVRQQTSLLLCFIASLEERGKDGETEAQGIIISNWISLDSEIALIPMFFPAQRHCTHIL